MRFPVRAPPCPSTSTCCVKVCTCVCSSAWTRGRREGEANRGPIETQGGRPSQFLPTPPTAKGGDVAAVRASEAARFSKPDTVDRVIALDASWRDTQSEYETKQMEFNAVVKQIAQLRKVRCVLCVARDGGN